MPNNTLVHSGKNYNQVIIVEKFLQNAFIHRNKKSYFVSAKTKCFQFTTSSVSRTSECKFLLLLEDWFKSCSVDKVLSVSRLNVCCWARGFSLCGPQLRLVSSCTFAAPLTKKWICGLFWCEDQLASNGWCQCRWRSDPLVSLPRSLCCIHTRPQVCGVGAKRVIH